MTDRQPTFRKGDEYYAARPPLGTDGVVIRVAQDAGGPGLPYADKVWVETVGEDGRGRRGRWLESAQLHDSPTTAAGQPRRSGYIRLRPGQDAPPLVAASPGRISDPAPSADSDAVCDPAALRLALDDAARSLCEAGLPLDGSPAPVSAADSAPDWAHRVGVLYETLVLLAARVEPYAAAPGSAERRVRAAVAAAGGSPVVGQPTEQRLK